jgi:hypothetical protein
MSQFIELRCSAELNPAHGVLRVCFHLWFPHTGLFFVACLKPERPGPKPETTLSAWPLLRQRPSGVSMLSHGFSRDSSAVTFTRASRHTNQTDLTLPTAKAKGVLGSSRRLATSGLPTRSSGHLSPSVSRPHRNVGSRMPSGTVQCFSQDVQGGILIPIQHQTAMGTDMRPYR